MVAAISAISAGLSISANLYNIANGGLNTPDQIDEINGKVDQLLTLSNQLLVNVEANRQAIIANYLSGVHSDVKQAVNAWTAYRATGLEVDRQKAIAKSSEALADITSFASVSTAEDTTLAPFLIAASAARLNIMRDLQDGATSAELKPELNETIPDLEAILNPLFLEARELIEVRLIAFTKLNDIEWDVTLEFRTSSAPVVTADQVVRTIHHAFFGFEVPFADGYNPQLWEIVDAAAFFEEVARYPNFVQYVADRAYPAARLEFERAGGTELEALIADMQHATSGEWHQGSDGLDDQLFSDSSPTYDKPDVLDGNGGDDLLVGGAGDDLLRGGRGDDYLLGEDGNDVLRGGADNDRIYGGEGDDLIDGGAGIDEVTFAFAARGAVVNLERTQPWVNRNGKDQIINIENMEGSDFRDSLRGDDNDNHLRGRNGDDLLYGAGGNDTLEGEEGDDEISGDAGIDTAVYGTDDVTVNGVSPFAEIDLSLTGFQNTGDFGNDKLIGIENVTTGKGNDTLKGDDNDNHLQAGGGDDLLEGRLGDDTLDGGTGEDMAMFRGEGAATVDLSVTGGQDTGYGQDTLIRIENLLTGGGNDSLTGDDNGNRLMAGLGDDTISGGGGDDFLAGGAGSDTALFDLTTRVTVDLSVADAQDTGAGNDVLLEIENVTSGSGKDQLTGDDGNNVLRSQDGNDKLEGGLGNDRLEGGNGNDKLEGGLGGDRLIGGAGKDTALFTGTTDTNVRLNKARAQDTGHGMDRLIGIENVSTGAGNDKLTGNGGRNKLLAGAGNDVLSGLGGNDILNGGAGIDTALFDGGVDIEVRLTTKRIQTTGHGNDRLIGIENITTGGGDDELTGNGQDNVLISNGGTDLLKGGSGADTLNAGTGADTVKGGAGADTLIAGKGADILVGNGGVDTFVFGRKDGANTINDFKNGIDKIEIRDGNTTATFDDIKVTDQGRNTLVEYRGTDVLLLKFNHTLIDETDFIF